MNSGDCNGITESTIRSVARYDGKPRSHALRGNAVFDAPRRKSRRRAAERQNEHSHAERGNENLVALLKCRMLSLFRLSRGARSFDRRRAFTAGDRFHISQQLLVNCKLFKP